MTRALFSISALALIFGVACEDSQSNKDEGTIDSGLFDDTGGGDGGNTADNDADDDGILDAHEGEEDPDGDGIPNYQDTDSDGDGIPDSIEAGDDDLNTKPMDSDEDGVPDYLDDDTDGNGIPDSEEAGTDPESPRDSDGDGVPDFRDDDNDGDGIKDSWEIDDPSSPTDTDGDTLPDYLDQDSDDDGICDEWEGGTTAYKDEPVDSDGDGTPDYRDLDSDDDGFSDAEEANVSGYCGQPSDADGDGTWNSADTDSDGDGISDRDEVDIYRTDPYDSDSDGDGQTDGAEVAAGTDPLDSESTIEGVYVEVEERTYTETVFSFTPRIQYGDILLMVDTTGSMSSTLNSVADRFSEIVTEISDNFENIGFAVATFDDYNYGSMGGGSDKPYILLQQLTDSVTDVQTVLNSIPLHSGGDGQESDMEALYQAITGNGYDQSCDGSYTSTTDVPPFIATSGDAFGGGASETYDSSVSGTGSNFGFGGRDYSLPIIIWATDIYMRDPDSSNSTLAQTPGGCPFDAGSTDVIAGLADIGGYAIGLDVGSYDTTNTYSPYLAMVALAEASGSVADLDEDGDADDPLVFHIPQGNSSFSEELVENISTAVEQLVSSQTFNKVSLQVAGDNNNLVQSIDPEYYEELEYEGISELDFTITFLGTVAATEEDQFFTMTLQVLADDTLLLDELDIVVVLAGKGS